MRVNPTSLEQLSRDANREIDLLRKKGVDNSLGQGALNSAATQLHIWFGAGGAAGTFTATVRKLRVRRF